MGLSTSLNTAIGGLNATQLGIGVVSQNVANAGTTGYVRRSVSTADSLSGRGGLRTCAAISCCAPWRTGTSRCPARRAGPATMSGARPRPLDPGNLIAQQTGAQFLTARSFGKGRHAPMHSPASRP